MKNRQDDNIRDHSISPVNMVVKGDPKVALVHDFLLCYGGAEKVLEVLCEMFPKAPIYTILHDKKSMRGKFSDHEIHTSFLQSLPRFLRVRPKWLLPLLPTAPETFDLREFDLVISSSGAWSKGIITRLNTKHIAYIHSPMRFIWDYNERYVQSTHGKNPGFLTRTLLSYLRLWDHQAAKRPDVLIANSLYTQKRITKYYRRESVVIYPPAVSLQRTNDRIQTSHTSQISDFGFQDGRYFLVVARLSPYKNTALVIDVCNKLELPLVVVGEGKQKKYLEKIAGKTIRIVGWQSEDLLQKHYHNARALIFASEDDFGIVCVEALSCGVPVIALGHGGALEIVEEGTMGEFFDAPVSESLADALRRFLKKEGSYNLDAMKRSAERFRREKFEKNFRLCVENLISNE